MDKVSFIISLAWCQVQLYFCYLIKHMPNLVYDDLQLPRLFNQLI